MAIGSVLKHLMESKTRGARFSFPILSPHPTSQYKGKSPIKGGKVLDVVGVKISLYLRLKLLIGC